MKKTSNTIMLLKNVKKCHHEETFLPDFLGISRKNHEEYFSLLKTLHET